MDDTQERPPDTWTTKNYTAHEVFKERYLGGLSFRVHWNSEASYVPELTD